jgi:SulP family sulfate permease
VVIAIGCAMLLLLYRTANPHDAVLGRVADTGEFHDLARNSAAQPLPGVVLYRLDAPLIFINADHFKTRVREVIGAAPTSARAFVLVAESMPLVDTTGAATLAEVCEELATAGVTVAVAGAHANVREMLDRAGLTERVGPGHIHATVAAAVAALSGEPAS